ncbi:MAG: hypothetical protein ACE5GB_12430, partial [Acidimicrobiales bacterium]
ASGTVEVNVSDVVRLSIDEVLGSARHRRAGYRLAARAADGDSGAGVYDEHDRLAAIVFATTSDDPATAWATASSEVSAFLHDAVDGSGWSCEPARSRVVEDDQAKLNENDPSSP